MERDHLSDARWGWANAKPLHRIAQQLRDAAQWELASEEAGNRHTVGSDERTWGGATSSASLQGNRQAREAHKVRRGEGQRSVRYEIHVRDY
jgi:hypothetical protein